MDKKKVILVDHNEIGQAVDGLHEAEIEEIIDHHKLGFVETIRPIMFRNQPVGCTATIIYMMFKENKIEIPEKIAGLMFRISILFCIVPQLVLPLIKLLRKNWRRLQG